jgi:hypothetical protein
MKEKRFTDEQIATGRVDALAGRGGARERREAPAASGTISKIQSFYMRDPRPIWSRCRCRPDLPG